MNTPKDSTGGCCPPPPCSADLFPKWKWMMDYCRERRWHPSDFWDVAEKAWREKFEPNRSGKCGMPSACEIDASGTCITGRACREVIKVEKATLRNPREGD